MRTSPSNCPATACTSWLATAGKTKLRHTIQLALITLVAQDVSAVQATDAVLETRATCVQNPQCRFDGNPVAINIAINNPGEHPIDCAFTVLQAKGPYTTLVDTVSGRRMEIPASMPPRAADVSMTRLFPGDTWSVRTVILAQEMQAVGKRRDVDLDVHLSFDVPGEAPVTGEKIDCTGSTTLRIADTPDAELP